METLLSVCMGVCLSAACGFRVFVPLLAASIASLTGHLTLSPGFSWVGSYPALIAFSAATVVEIAGYYIPWVDHLLDTIATPAAVVAGAIVTASVVAPMDPFLKWTLALVAGGGTAGLVQGATVLSRGASTATTGGLGNPVIATIELAGSVIASLLALLAPLAALALLALFVVVFARFLLRRRRKGSPAPPQAPTS